MAMRAESIGVPLNISKINKHMAPLKDPEHPAVRQINYLILPAAAYLYYYE